MRPTVPTASPAAFARACLTATTVILVLSGCLVATCDAVVGDPPALPGHAEGSGSGVEKRGERMVIEVRRQTAVEVKVGTTVDLIVTSPVAIPFQLRCQWSDSPEIEGGAVRFLGTSVELPPPDVDGGVATHHYQIEAVAPGEARVILTATAASPEAICPPRRLDIVVRASST